MRGVFSCFALMMRCPGNLYAHEICWEGEKMTICTVHTGFFTLSTFMHRVGTKRQRIPICHASLLTGTLTGTNILWLVLCNHPPHSLRPHYLPGFAGKRLQLQHRVELTHFSNHFVRQCCTSLCVVWLILIVKQMGSYSSIHCLYIGRDLAESHHRRIRYWPNQLTTPVTPWLALLLWSSGFFAISLRCKLPRCSNCLGCRTQKFANT